MPSLLRRNSMFCNLPCPKGSENLFLLPVAIIRAFQVKGRETVAPTFLFVNIFLKISFYLKDTETIC